MTGWYGLLPNAEKVWNTSTENGGACQGCKDLEYQLVRLREYSAERAGAEVREYLALKAENAELRSGLVFYAVENAKLAGTMRDAGEAHGETVIKFPDPMTSMSYAAPACSRCGADNVRLKPDAWICSKCEACADDAHGEVPQAYLGNPQCLCIVLPPDHEDDPDCQCSRCTPNCGFCNCKMQLVRPGKWQCVCPDCVINRE